MYFTDREEKAPAGGDPRVAVGREATAGDDAVDVRMVRKRAGPGVQDRGDAGQAAEPLGVGSELDEGLGSGDEHHVVNADRITQGQGIEFLRDGEHDVEVVCGQDALASRLDPRGLLERLALGAMTMRHEL